MSDKKVKSKKPVKLIFVSGGVISGIGKGISTASIALLLQSAGYRVSILKFDMYLNVDAGTMNPLEHGEVFVTDDALETDQDLGNYERFLTQNFYRDNYLTMGQIYWEILNKERALGYKGKTVQGHIHVPEHIIEKIYEAAAKTESEIFLVEVGGTVGEYQNMLFFEAIRRLKQKDPENVFLAHLVYLITPSSLGEMKSKPAQASIYDLYKLGLHPDIVICRSSQPMDEKRKETIAFNTGINLDQIFSAPDVKSVYEIPLLFKEQNLDDKLLKKLNLKRKENKIVNWENFVDRVHNSNKKIKIAIVGKYFTSGNFSLEDAYVCVIEAIKHAAWAQNCQPEIKWFNVEDFEDEQKKKIISTELKSFDGIIIPQGWGSRGVEGKIEALKFIRENKIPYLGLCFGMQMAVIEYARNILNLKGANTTEADPDTKYPVIHVMPEQEKYLKENKFGGTIRLGAWPCKLSANSTALNLYEEFAPDTIKNGIINERHRHRYEVNNEYKDQLQKAGLIISGTSPDGKLAEIVELPKNVHPFFIGTQFHPEYKSWPLKPHPLFMGFIRASLKNKN